MFYYSRDRGFIKEDFELSVEAKPGKEVKIDAEGSDADEVKAFARAMFGDNFDFFETEFEPKEEQEVESEEEPEDTEAEIEEVSDEEESEEEEEPEEADESLLGTAIGAAHAVKKFLGEEKEESEENEVFPNPEKNHLVDTYKDVAIYDCTCGKFVAMIDGKKVKKETVDELKKCIDNECEEELEEDVIAAEAPKADVPVEVENEKAPEKKVCDKCGKEICECGDQLVEANLTEGPILNKIKDKVANTAAAIMSGAKKVDDIYSSYQVTVYTKKDGQPVGKMSNINNFAEAERKAKVASNRYKVNDKEGTYAVISGVGSKVDNIEDQPIKSFNLGRVSGLDQTKAILDKAAAIRRSGISDADFDSEEKPAEQPAVEPVKASEPAEQQIEETNEQDKKESAEQTEEKTEESKNENPVADEKSTEQPENKSENVAVAEKPAEQQEQKQEVEETPKSGKLTPNKKGEYNQKIAAVLKQLGISDADIQRLSKRTGNKKITGLGMIRKAVLGEAFEEDDSDVITEETHAKYAKPEGNKLEAFNNALELAKAADTPYIYGYDNHTGKFFALPQPIKCKDGLSCEKEFRQRYKNCNVVYVAYPDKEFR